jgi:hypothetical protein
MKVFIDLNETFAVKAFTGDCIQEKISRCVRNMYNINVGIVSLIVKMVLMIRPRNIKIAGFGVDAGYLKVKSDFSGLKISKNVGRNKKNLIFASRLRKNYRFKG